MALLSDDIEIHHPGACAMCGRDQNRSLSCETRTMQIGGVTYLAIPFGRESWCFERPKYRCVGCGAFPNGLHHHRCVEAECPRCGGRVARCRC